MRRSKNLLGFTLFLALAGCACDQQKHESIKAMNAGIEKASLKSYTAAEKDLERATMLDPENHKAAYALSLVFIEQKKWDKAEGALSTALKFQKTDAMYHYHLGHALYEQKKHDMARGSLEEAVKLNKRLYKAHYYLGLVHKAEDRPRDAAAAFSESCRLNPKFGKPFYELGRLYFSWDHLEEARQVLIQGAQYAMDNEDMTNIWYQLGQSYDGLKQYDKAVEAYKKALDARKDNLEAVLQLGLAYANLGDKANARKNLEDFVKQGGGGNDFNIAAANSRLLKLSGE